MQRPRKQLAIQQLAIAIQQQQIQQYMRKTDFILQNTYPIVDYNYDYDYDYEEPDFIFEEPDFINDGEKVIEEPEVVELTITQVDNREIIESNNIYTEPHDINTNEMQETPLPIKNKKKNFNTDKIKNIVEINQQEPFNVSRKNIIEKVLSTLITKFMLSRQ